MARNLVVLLPLVLGCAEDVTGETAELGDECTPGEVRCEGPEYQECLAGHWELDSFCPDACSEDLGGCVRCDPEASGGRVCDGSTTVVSCEPDGTFGPVVQECGQEQTCVLGQCQGECTADGVDLIYVVDSSYRLLSFDPRRLASGDEPFRLVGDLACDTAYGPVPGWGASTPTPFSMSVARDGKAWVLYTSGEIFLVDLVDASCEPSGFPRLQEGPGGPWALFGMGFVTDTPGGNTERLFVGGGSPDPSPGGQFGYVEPSTLEIETVGMLPTQVENSPEFTGTGNAEIFAYFPGTVSTIRQLDKASGIPIGPSLDAGSVAGGVRAWAFAHWGGKFYIFVTDGTGNSTVRRTDRDTTLYEGVVREGLPYVIVGAGVSTCAPVVGGI